MYCKLGSWSFGPAHSNIFLFFLKFSWNSSYQTRTPFYYKQCLGNHSMGAIGLIISKGAQKLGRWRNGEIICRGKGFLSLRYYKTFTGCTWWPCAKVGRWKMMKFPADLPYLNLEFCNWMISWNWVGAIHLLEYQCREGRFDTKCQYAGLLLSVWLRQPQWLGDQGLTLCDVFGGYFGPWHQIVNTGNIKC